MKTQKAPLSIRIIYWLTSFSLGMLTLVFIGAIIFNLMVNFNMFSNELDLAIELPVKVNFLEKGNLYLNNTDIEVELVEATSRIQFKDTPSFISRKIAFALLIVVSFGIYLFWTFRKFIKNVKDGIVFTMDNIGLLKKLAYGIAAFWLFSTVYLNIVRHYIASKLEFDNIEITSDVSNYSGILYLALFIWVLAHIFMTGLKLQEDQDLTI